LEPHDAVAKRHLKLETIPEPLAIHLEQQGVSLRRALRFTRVTTEQAAVVVRISRGLSFSLRSLEECARMIDEVAARDDLTWLDVAERAGLLDALTAKDRAQDKAKAGMKTLWSLRYPTWHEAGQRAHEKAAAVGASEHVRLSWDETFDKEGLVVTINAPTIDALDAELRALSSPERLKRLADLFDNL